MSVDVLIFTDVAKLEYGRPAGAYRVATELRAHGFSVQVVDHFTYLARGGLKRLFVLIDKFVGANTLFVGFSTTFFVVEHDRKPVVRNPQIPLTEERAEELVARIRRRNPRTKIVAGGAKAALVDHGRLIDAFIPGYADTTVVEYARYLDGKNPFFQYTPLPGGKMLLDRDQKASGFDFRHSKIDWQPEDHVREGEPLPIEISRGCIFRCKYCSFPLNGKHNDLAFLKDTDSLYDELVANYDRYGITSYLFSDDTFNDSVEKLEILAKLFKRLPFRIRYSTYIRHDLIWKHRETAALLLESGLVSANFGVETLNHAAGKSIGKGLHPDKTRELLHWLRDEVWGDQVLTYSGFIIGLPHETPDTVRQWADEVLDPDFPLDGFRFNGLQIHRYAKRSNLSDFEQNYDKYGYRFPDPELPLHWENDAFSLDSAMDMVVDIMDRADRSHRNRLGGFLPFMYQNLGYRWDDIKKMSIGDARFSELLRRRNNLVDSYYERLVKH
jgi:radical SAM superfamily enzyme YgiQ (UPF0313 family)